LALNPLKAAWATGRAASNGWLTLPHLIVAEVMAAQDWATIARDMHDPNGCADDQACACRLLMRTTSQEG
jgi:2-keto-3-deoxy-L-rhamnonate aldolase RhmA